MGKVTSPIDYNSPIEVRDSKGDLIPLFARFSASGERCWVSAGEEEKEGFDPDPCPTDIRATIKVLSAHLETIKTAQAKKKMTQGARDKIKAAAKAINALLINPFVYSLSGFNTNDSRYYWVQQPIIEALFFEHNSLFQKFISSVIKLNNDVLYKAIISAMNVTDFPRAALFEWNEAMKIKVDKEIKAMRRYGKKLKGEPEKDSKSETKQKASEIQVDLRQKANKSKLFDPILGGTDVYSELVHKVPVYVPAAEREIPHEDLLDEENDTPEMKRGKLAKQVAFRLSKQLR